MSFAPNKPIYVIDNGTWNTKKQIKITKHNITGFSNDKTKLILSGSNLSVALWAVSKTKQDAIKLAISFLIKTEELLEPINNGIDGIELYTQYNNSYPELVLKYLDSVID